MKQFTLEQFEQLLLESPDKFPNTEFELTRRLPTGEIIGVRRLAFTFALCIGIDEFNLFTFRFCYPKFSDAVSAFMAVTDPYAIPRSAWVAARPETRFMLPKHLFDMKLCKADQQTLHTMLTDGATIEQYIGCGLYTANRLRRWLRENNPNPDKGVIGFTKIIELC